MFKDGSCATSTVQPRLRNVADTLCHAVVVYIDVGKERHVLPATLKLVLLRSLSEAPSDVILLSFVLLGYAEWRLLSLVSYAKTTYTSTRHEKILPRSFLSVKRGPCNPPQRSWRRPL